LRTFHVSLAPNGLPGCGICAIDKTPDKGGEPTPHILTRIEDTTQNATGAVSGLKHNGFADDKITVTAPDDGGT